MRAPSASIVADPASDAPRLAFARALPAGDPLAEFIGVQCALARSDPPPPDLVRREAELLRAHGEAWLEALGLDGGVMAEPTVNSSLWARCCSDPAGGPPYLRRGFLDRLRLSAAELAAAAPRAALPQQVVRSVHVDGAEDPAVWTEVLAALASLPHLSALHVEGPPFGAPLPAGLWDALCAHPLAARLRSLDVESPEGDWVGALARSAARPTALGIGFTELRAPSVAALAPHLRGLEALVGYGAMDDATAGALASAGLHLRRLVHGRLSVEGLAALLAGVPSLREVLLHSARLAPDEAAALALRPELAQLDTLSVTGRGLGALAASPHLSAVRSLTLVSSEWTEDDVRVLAASALPALERLRVVGLGAPRVPAEALAALARAPWFGRLDTLELLRLGPSVGEALAQASGGPRELLLAENELGDDELAALAAAPVLRRVVHLDLNSNEIGARGVARLLDSAHTSALRCLNLWFNPGPDAEVAQRGFVSTGAGRWCR